jgi:hypothetical protein
VKYNPRDWTTIALRRETKRELEELKKKNDNFDCVVRRIIREARGGVWGDERGALTVWIDVLVGVFIFGVVFAVLGDFLGAHIITEAVSSAHVNTPQDYFDTVSKFQLLLNVFPVVMIFGVIVYAYVHVQRRGGGVE